MALPAEIQKIQEEGEKLEAELYGKPAVPPALPAEPVTVPEPAPEPPPEEPVPAPAEPAPEPSPEPTPELVPAPVKPEDFKHKYDVLQGKYNKEVPRLAENVRASNDAIISLRDENSRLLAVITEFRRTATGDPKPAAPVDTAIDTDPDVSYLKNEYPDVAKAVTKLVTAKDVAIQKQLETLNQNLTQVLTETKVNKEEKFYNILDTRVKNWEEINNSVEFKTWSAKPDRYTGQSKTSLIKAASQRLDGNTTANFFEDFLAETAPAPTEPVPPASPRKPANLHPPRPSTARIPERPATEPQKEIITTAQITAFTDDVRRGKFIGREAEQKLLEAEVDLAAMEGRIR
jgi:outer membrane biosynthesis protein TonB